MRGLTKEIVREWFDYRDGDLIWKKDKARARQGDVAGSLMAQGYIIVGLNGSLYVAHRIVYLYHHGEIEDGLQIDHINGNRSDNRIENLRLVTHMENQWNRKNTKGYTYDRDKKRWRVQLSVNGKKKYIGLFATEEEAKKEAKAAKKKYHVIQERL